MANFSKTIPSVVAVLAFLAGAPAAQAGTVKIAVPGLTVGEGVSVGAGGALTNVVVAELRKQPGTDVLTAQEITALLNHEQQKQMMGCQTDKCRADLGGVVGADRLLTGSISKLGESWLLQLTLLDVAKATVVAQVDRRQKGGNVDDLLDAIPAMVKQLLAGQARSDQAAVGASAPSPVAAAGMPRHGAEIPVAAADIPKGLKLVTDGKGMYFAFIPGNNRTLYFGDGKTLWDAYITGGGKNGAAFNMTFWEPRVGFDRWKGGVDFKPEGATLQCGDNAIPLTAVADAQSATILKSARLLAPRWQRTVVALLRDDMGNYYLVDQKRGAPGKELRLYTGKKAAMKPAAVEDASMEGSETLIITPTGRLKITRDANTGKPVASWLEGQASTSLTWLDPDVNAPLIYKELSAYQTEPLGTPCDGRL